MIMKNFLNVDFILGFSTAVLVCLLLMLFIPKPKPKPCQGFIFGAPVIIKYKSGTYSDTTSLFVTVEKYYSDSSPAKSYENFFKAHSNQYFTIDSTGKGKLHKRNSIYNVHK